MRHPMTSDWGLEMVRHQELSERTGLNIYSTNPTQPVKARYQRKHHNSVAPISAQRRRSQRRLAGRTRRYSR
jgi:hypothetical protein